MLSIYTWFGTVLGYVSQTKCLSIIQSQLLTRNLAKGNNTLKNPLSKEETSYILTIYLTFIYCVSLLFMLPISQFISEKLSNAQNINLNEDPESIQTDPPFIEMELLDAHSEEHDFNDGTDISTGTNNLIHSSSDSNTNLNSIALSTSSSSNDNTIAYLGKLIVLSIFLIIPLFTYIYALSLSPAFDVSLIQNTAVFEITTLLLGVFNISKKKNLFRNFFIMMMALIGILIISYTKATCDLLSGKLSINQHTGEVVDPFLFDRLKAGLVCGLGSLAIGPFVVLWHHWFIKGKNVHSENTAPSTRDFLVKQSTHISLIGTLCLFMLLPFIPNISNSFQIISLLYMDKFFWVTIMGSIIFGTVPHILSIIGLTNEKSPEYLTTCNLGAIIFMGLAEWISEPSQTTIVRWEVIGYIMLASSCIFLSISYD